MGGADLLTPLWLATSLPKWSLREWEDVLGQARQARLQARLATFIADKGWMPAVPKGPDQYVLNALMAAERQHREVTWEIDRIESALAGVDTPVVILKGAAYLTAKLPPARGRLFSDVDILVAHEHLAAVEAALFVAGWIPEKHDAYDDRYYRQWMHELPPLKHVQRGTFIDVHHTITPPTSRFRVDGQRLLARARPLSSGSGKLFVLDAPDMVLHSAAHLFQEGEFDHGLRDLLDLNDLLIHFAAENALFWAALIARANELSLQVPLYHALRHVKRLFGTAPPTEFEDAIQKMQPNPMARAAMDGLLGLALRPIHPSCDGRFSAAARALLYIRSHYLRMPIHLLVPHLLRKAYKRHFPDKPAGDELN